MLLHERGQTLVVCANRATHSHPHAAKPLLQTTPLLALPEPPCVCIFVSGWRLFGVDFRAVAALQWVCDVWGVVEEKWEESHVSVWEVGRVNDWWLWTDTLPHTPFTSLLGTEQRRNKTPCTEDSVHWWVSSIKQLFSVQLAFKWISPFGLSSLLVLLDLAWLLTSSHLVNQCHCWPFGMVRCNIGWNKIKLF